MDTEPTPVPSAEELTATDPRLAEVGERIGEARRAADEVAEGENLSDAERAAAAESGARSGPDHEGEEVGGEPTGEGSEVAPG